jgi:Ca2+-binding RTX toxin-like protein
MHGGSGDDVVYGGSKDDYVVGDSGRDTLWGGYNDDTIVADDGEPDDAIAGSGYDTCLVDSLDFVSSCEATN